MRLQVRHASMPDKTAGPTPLTFHWSLSTLRERGLLFWGFIVALGLAAFFYLFQVVYPQSQRFTPVPQQVVMLNPAEPAARGLMNKVQDRDFLIVPATTAAASGVTLEARVPVFHPSFEGHKLDLKDLPHKAFSVPPARLLEMDAPVLPPLDLSEIKSVPSVPGMPVMGAPRLVMKLSGELAGHAMAGVPDFSALTLSDPGSCRFQLGVNAEGRVEFVLPITASEKPDVLEKLTQVLQRLRFVPASPATTTPVWGQAGFAWSTGGAP